MYEAGNGIELLELLEKTNPKPEIILLDLHMPEMDGIEAHKKIKEHLSRNKNNYSYYGR